MQNCLCMQINFITWRGTKKNICLHNVCYVWTMNEVFGLSYFLFPSSISRWISKKKKIVFYSLFRYTVSHSALRLSISRSFARSIYSFHFIYFDFCLASKRISRLICRVAGRVFFSSFFNAECFYFIEMTCIMGRLRQKTHPARIVE